MTAIFMGASGNQKIQFADGGLDTTVTSMGNAQFDAEADSEGAPCYAYGVSVASTNFLSLGTFGTLGQDTFTDGSSISRTVSAIYYTELCTGDADDDNLFFSLDDQSMDNDDGDFISIDYNGTNYTRSSATFTGTTGSCSTWRWLNISPNGPESGNPALVVNV